MLRFIGQAVGLSLFFVAASPALCENDWVLLGGSAEYDQPGVPWNPAPGSEAYPMARSLSAIWVDGQGDFWMYGGSGRNGSMGDLWRYEPDNEIWTYVDGQTTGTSQIVYPAAVGGVGNPGSRYGAGCWVEGGRHLWLFGGYGRARTGASTWGNGTLNDLWKYVIATDTWYWMGGSQYVTDPGDYEHASESGWPSGRYFVNGVSDGRTYYMYGGMDDNSRRLQDFWMLDFDADPPEFTLLGGDATTNTVATVPGTLDGTGYPGSRFGQAMWLDDSFNVWLYGGYGYYTATPGFLNDTWKYTPAGNQWTLQATNAVGTYPASHGGFGKPAKRRNAAVWRTNDGLFMFGGTGTHPTTGNTRFNDLWMLNETTGQWQWLDGTDSSSAPIPDYPAYGITGSPLRRGEMNYWLNEDEGKLYFFGGTAGTSADYCHDFWVRDATYEPTAAADWQLWQ